MANIHRTGGQGTGIGHMLPRQRSLHQKGYAMIGDKKVMQSLQSQLKIELTAINQYFVHYRMLEHWGFSELGKKEYKASIHAMKYTDRLMERVFILDGLPNLQDLGKLRIGETVEELLECDLALEYESQKNLRDGIIACEEVLDYVSRDTLRRLLDETEERIDYLDTQLALIQKIGPENYMQSQLGEAEAH